MNFLHFLSLIFLALLYPGAVEGDDEPVPVAPVVLLPGVATELPRMLYAFNSQLVGSTMSPTGIGYDSIAFAGIVAKLNPGGVRFPGGTVGNHYLWRTDSFEKPSGDLTKWAAKLLGEFADGGFDYGLDAFIDLSLRLGFEPIWMLNIFNNSPEDAVDWVRYIRGQGGSVRFVELGNESYWDARSHNDLDAYVGYARPIAEALRMEDPSIRIGVNIGPFGRKGNYEEIWNEPIARDLSWYDAVIHHEYIGGQGIAVDEGRQGPVFEAVFADRELEESLRKTRVTHKDKPLWITEWNIGGGMRNDYGQSMAHLLAQASIYAFLMNHPDEFELGGLHQIEGGKWGTYTSGPDGEIITQSSFYLWKMIGDATLRADAFFPLEVDGAGSAGGSPLQIALGYGTANGVDSVFIINRDEALLTLDLRTVFGDKDRVLRVRQIAGDAADLGLPFPSGVDPAIEMNCPVGEVVAAPYSISLIER